MFCFKRNSHFSISYRHTNQAEILLACIWRIYKMHIHKLKHILLIAPELTFLKLNTISVMNTNTSLEDN